MYGGYATSFARGEPISYEEGHALNGWLADHNAVDGVWYGWGPYIWAPVCESGGTNASGARYDREESVADGVHPSGSGQAKIARLIHDHFKPEA